MHGVPPGFIQHASFYSIKSDPVIQSIKSLISPIRGRGGKKGYRDAVFLLRPPKSMYKKLLVGQTWQHRINIIRTLVTTKWQTGQNDLEEEKTVLLFSFSSQSFLLILQTFSCVKYMPAKETDLWWKDNKWAQYILTFHGFLLCTAINLKPIMFCLNI